MKPHFRLKTFGTFCVWLLPAYGYAAVPQTCAGPLAGPYKCPIDLSIDPTALCNDGTTPAFSLRPGTGSGANNWVIWLEGGSDCFDQLSCFTRATNPKDIIKPCTISKYTTSCGFTASGGVGILSSDPAENPALYNANFVVVHYCSSDTWAGNQSKKATMSPFDPNNTDTWNFTGRSIAKAAITTLRKIEPSFTSTSKILIGGSSAGGEGITVTANDILPLLPSTDVLFVNDAGFGLDIGQCDGDAADQYVYQGHPNAFESNILLRLALWNGRGDAMCDSMATTAEQHAACYDSGYVLQNNFVKLPSFVAESQLDTAQVTLEICPPYGNCSVSHNPTDQTAIYATAFARQMANAVVGTGTAATYTGFTPDQYMHVILADETVFKTPMQFSSGNLTPRAALNTWLGNPTGPRVVNVGNAPGVKGQTLGLNGKMPKPTTTCPGTAARFK